MTFPDWKLERYLLGELSPEATEEIRKREQTEDILRERLKKLRQDNEEILSLYPPEEMVPQIKSRSFQVKKKASSRNYIPLWAAALFAIACIPGIPVIFDEIQNSERAGVVSESGIEVTRIKGFAPRLEVWLKQSGEAEALANNASVKAGDEVQLRYSVAERCYGMLVSLDGNGILTAHLPENSFQAQLLEPGQMTFLDKAYRLDNAPDFEIFYLITSAEPFAVEPGKFDSLLNQKEVTITQLALRKG
ncbi:MAG: hypothetical protein LBR60_00285 [Fibrobacter sp.]|jgi:hypothetical protein|nr:hypothetical protein [Fibrobacter sp.]